MHRFSRAVGLVALLVAMFMGELAAQGVTSAALYGIVRSADSGGIAEAVVTVTNTSDGGRWRTTTRADGRYAFEYLSVGGPYAVEARAIGFSPGGERGIALSLGERRRIDVVLVPAVTQLAELTVQAGDRLNGNRTGPGQTFTGAQAAALPLNNRDFSQLVLLSPQATVSRDTGISIAGQPDRLNGLQIDGASATDLGGTHGISQFGTPGAASRIRVLPIEAVQELQVLIAPFDVRYSEFAGGLVNAITRSGANHWEGSVSTYFQNQSLTGKDSFDLRAQDFTTKEVAVTLGGPIVRDRAAFFVDAGLQRFVGARGRFIGADTTDGADSAGIGVRQTDLAGFRDILRDTYHVDAGAFGPGTPHNPSGNVLAKVTVWPALNQRIEFSHNHSEGTSTGGFDVLEFASHGRTEPATFDATRAAWTVGGAGLTNELTLARVGATQRCIANAEFPEINVDVEPPPDSRTLVAGAVNGCPDQFARQTTWELTDNASWVMGPHHLTLGTHEENIHLDGSRRVLVPRGRWRFMSFDSLASGTAFQYLRDFRAPTRTGPVSDYTVQQGGLYAQDQWMPRPEFLLTAGLRFDLPFLPREPAYNPALWSAFGIDNALTPSGHVLWSPRLGFNYDVGSRGTTFLRGGVGLFSGRPMFLYFSNVFEATGLDWRRVICPPGDVPAFTIDPAHQPTSCLQRPPIVSEVAYFDPSFRFPRNLRLSLGGDVRLPWGMVGTADLLYIRGVNQFDITDANLKPPSGLSAGEGGRLLYGTFDPSGTPTPNRIDPTFGPVNRIRNASGDRAISVSGQVEKRFAGGTDVSLAYTYTDARDRMSPGCFYVTCNLYLTPLDGTVDHRRLTTSDFSIPHKVTLGLVMNAPLNFRVGVTYNGSSGLPYGYVVEGDANADGLEFIGYGNDLVYVPRDSTDITLEFPEEWAVLDSMIRGDGCLRAQRGRVMRRNSCRGSWTTLLNARVSKVFGTGKGHSLELITDVFNVLNVFDRDWGVQRVVYSVLGSVTMLHLAGYDQANQRGVYDVVRVDRRARDFEGTRWRLQLGARYTY